MLLTAGLSGPKDGKIYGIGKNIPGSEASALRSHSGTQLFFLFQITLKTRMCGIYGILSRFFSYELSLFGVARNVCRLVYPSRSGCILPVNAGD